MKPILDDMSKAYAGKAIVMTVDMDANKDLVRDFRIRMMPTQVFLTPDGKEFSETKGPLSESKSLRSSPRWAWDSRVCKVLLDSSLRRLPPRPLPHIRMPPGKRWNQWRRMERGFTSCILHKRKASKTQHGIIEAQMGGAKDGPAT